MKLHLSIEEHINSLLNVCKKNFLYTTVKKGRENMGKFLNKGNSNSSIYLEYFNMKVGESKELVCTIDYFKKFNLGYLIYQGFEVTNVEDLEDNRKKITITRVFDALKEDKHYSWLIKLPRTGKNGKRIYDYKMRTMQPYSEYLHKAMIQIVGFNCDGTIKNDFRITKAGKFMRKYWLDELPMLLNFFKGDLKVIGIRPLSDAMLSHYPQDFVPIRNKYKPGLIPPYYIDKPRTFDEIIESEKRYLEKYEKQRVLTDIEYFFKFLKRILFDGVRSS